MDKARISSDKRQMCYRANRAGITPDLEIADFPPILEAFNGECAFCGDEAQGFKVIIPFREVGLIPAVVAPACDYCITMKDDLIDCYLKHGIDTERYVWVVERLLNARCGDTVKEYLRRRMGR